MVRFWLFLGGGCVSLERIDALSALLSASWVQYAALVAVAGGVVAGVAGYVLRAWRRGF